MVIQCGNLELLEKQVPFAGYLLLTKPNFNFSMNEQRSYGTCLNENGKSKIQIRHISKNWV
jgi:hypothetical protein